LVTNSVNYRAPSLSLNTWLRSEQKKSGIAYLPPAQAKPAAEPDPEQAARAAERAALVGAMEETLRREKDPQRRVLHETMLHLLEFHQRESKPVW
jgi:hypothetical protein